MARAARTTRLCALAAALSAAGLALLLCQRVGGRGGQPMAAARLAAPSAMLESAGLIPLLLASLLTQVIPGVLLSASGYLLYLSPLPLTKSRGFVAALLVLGAVTFPLLKVPIGEDPMAEQKVEAPTQVWLPQSGEERLEKDGSFVRVFDPRRPTGSTRGAEDGWQVALWGSIMEAIQSGEAQVAIVFSTQGCPWCTKLLPVLRRALKRRNQGNPSVAAVPDQDDPTMDDVAAGGIGSAPLRIFVLEAEEFPSLVQQLGINGFPSILFFGEPGVAPRINPGYLDDNGFERALQKIAAEKPEDQEEAPPSGRRQQGKRRRFFR